MKQNNKCKIVLVGFMGTGKSTIAALLSAHLNWRAVDSDAVVVQSQGRAIAQIFEAEGEAEFRKIETNVLSDLLNSDEQLIIATGGGAVLSDHNRTMMLDHGIVIALHATAEAIVERVKHDTGRPLLQGDVHQNVEKLMRVRKQAYDFAPIQVDTTGKSSHTVVAEIIEILTNQQL